jgi:hypothetical protein
MSQKRPMSDVSKLSPKRPIIEAKETYHRGKSDPTYRVEMLRGLELYRVL